MMGILLGVVIPESQKKKSIMTFIVRSFSDFIKYHMILTMNVPKNI